MIINTILYLQLFVLVKRFLLFCNWSHLLHQYTINGGAGILFKVSLNSNKKYIVKIILCRGKDKMMRYSGAAGVPDDMLIGLIIGN